jgi:putative FmdB family regulatory protein
MPVYPYKCTTCPHHFDVAKSVRQIDDPETCPKCQSDSKRYLVAVNFNGASDWDKAEYNPGNEDVSKYITRQEQKVAAEQDANTEAALEPVVHGMKKILRGEKIE